MKLFTKLAVLPLVGLLGACTINYSTDNLRSLQGSNGTFQQALAGEYATLALAEDAEQDWNDADFFSALARSVAAGNEVGPQAISERTLNKEHGDWATVERVRLLSVLTPANKQHLPAAAAKAQAMFDCYLQEAEENTQPEDIAACLKGYEDAMAMLGKGVTNFIIYFDFASSALNNKAMAVLNPVADLAKSSGMSVMLSGHTDTVGDMDANKALSQARVNAAKAALVRAGVPANKISTDFYGEGKPQVATQDGTKAALNRRVEITVK